MSDPKQGRDPNRFFRSSLIYAFGDLLTKGARIVLIPYYMASLTKAEIGLWSVLQVAVLATWTLLAFGFGAAIQRFYHDYKDRGDAFVASLWWRKAEQSPGAKGSIHELSINSPNLSPAKDQLLNKPRCSLQYWMKFKLWIRGQECKC